MNQAPSTSACVDMCLLLTVSISIPAVTEDAVIGRCLIAAAEQTLLGLEIIVTLGGPRGHRGRRGDSVTLRRRRST